MHSDIELKCSSGLTAENLKDVDHSGQLRIIWLSVEARDGNSVAEMVPKGGNRVVYYKCALQVTPEGAQIFHKKLGPGAGCDWHAVLPVEATAEISPFRIYPPHNGVRVILLRNHAIRL